MNAEEKMLDYVGASSNKSIFVIVALITSVAFIGVDLPSGAIAYIFLLALLGLLIVVLSKKDMLSFLKDNNLYDEAISDFTRAVPFLDGRIRLSSKYIFGGNSCTILRYTDISRVYQYVHNVNFIERNRELRAVDNSGKVWTLCKLEVHRAFHSKTNKILDAKLADVLDFILYKNDRIAIGYKS